MPAPDYAVEIAQLEAALSAGELKIESDGDQLWLKSSADIIAQINYFRTKAAAAAGTQTRGSSVAVFSKD
jgi:hypothetical protein